MKRLLSRSTLFPAALLVCLAALAGRSGAVPPQPLFPNMIGLWEGDWTSDSGATGVASLNVTSQETRRFAGTFTFVPPDPITPPNPCEILGTASESGEISLNGRNDVFRLRAHGQLNEGLMTLNYTLDFADGSTETGTTTLSAIVIEPGS